MSSKETYIALLRGINVGGNKKVAMADLRALLARLGLTGITTLLQSGNALFRTAPKRCAELETMLEIEVKKQLGVECGFFVRTADEWHSIVAGNPFADAAVRDPGHLIVMCLRDAPDKVAVDDLRNAISGPEVVEVEGRTAYFIYPAGMGTSKLTNAVIEKKLRTRGTARNWNTVMKLERCASGASSSA